MPGRASLAAHQYYAHPRNAFWPIMGQLFGFDPAVPYQARCEALTASGVAVWDVLQACVRPGSLDSAIERRSEVPNAIADLLLTEPQLELIACNGGKSFQSLKTHLPTLFRERRDQIVQLPSTSPAFAAMRPDEKSQRWRVALSEVG